MDSNPLFTLGLGLTPPWRVVDQRFETDKKPHRLHLLVAAEPGARFPCPECGKLAAAHDWKDAAWQHLDFFQHACFITARVPRVRCPDHGVHRIAVPWARAESGFTLLFEQVALSFAREMPVATAADLIGITDKRLWRIVFHYVTRALERLNLSHVKAFACDETAAKRGHTYVTIFIDLDATEKPVLFVTDGRDKQTVHAFRAFLLKHQGQPSRIAEVVCDMSAAFTTAVGEAFPQASLTVDWFHVVQLFTKAVDQVRRAEAKSRKLPKATRWATLKNPERLTEKQRQALAELEQGGFATAEAYRCKEMIRWIRQSGSVNAAKWRLTHFVRHFRERLATLADEALAPLETAINTVEHHADRILRRWTSGHSNARLEGLNGIFQAARARARGYRSTATFACIIYLIAAPLGDLFSST
jgi:transposase